MEVKDNRWKSIGIEDGITPVIGVEEPDIGQGIAEAEIMQMEGDLENDNKFANRSKNRRIKKRKSKKVLLPLKNLHVKISEHSSENLRRKNKTRQSKNF